MLESTGESRTPIRKFNDFLETHLETQLPDDKGNGLNAALISARVDEDLSTRPLLKKIFPFVRKLYREPAITFTLASMELGSLSIKSAEKMHKNSPIGNNLIDMPIRMQFTSDIIDASSNADDQESRVDKIRKISEQYCLSGNELTVISHPDFYKRITQSALLSSTVYTLPRQVLGWGAFGGLLVSPEFKQIVDANQIGITALSALVLLAGGIARVRIDYKILEDVKVSPDIFETTLATSTGKVMENGELKPNAKWGFLGAPLDIAISSLQPPYSAAWFADLPYSVPAYLLAIYVDQVVFATTTIGWGTIIKRRNKNLKNEVSS